MPNYYFTEENGQKRLINEQELRKLAEIGIITPTTPLETESGHKGVAGQIQGLKFDTAAQPVENPARASGSGDIAKKLKDTFARNPVFFFVGGGVVLLVLAFVLIFIAVGSSSSGGRSSGSGKSQSDRTVNTLERLSAIEDEFMDALKREDGEAMKAAGRKLYNLDMSCFPADFRIAKQKCGSLMMDYGDACIEVQKTGTAEARQRSMKALERYGDAQEKADAIFYRMNSFLP